MTPKMKITYKKDEQGLLMCHICGYKPPVKNKKDKDGKNIIYQNRSTLCEHIKTHNDQLPHVCRFCNKGFLHKSVLETHISAIHPVDTDIKEKRFCCNVPACNYSTWQKGNLLTHKSRNHCADLVNEYLIQIEKEKNIIHKCSCCEESFDSGSHFHHHILKCLQRNNIELPISID